MQEQNKPKAKSRTINIKASSTRIVLDQSHKGFGNYNSRSPYNPMNKRGLYPHEAKRSVVDHGDEISGKGWIPCCHPTCSGAEGRWGLRCRLSLVSNSNGSLKLISGCSLPNLSAIPPLWRWLRGIYRRFWSVVLVKHRLGLTNTSRWRKLRPIGPGNGQGRPTQRAPGRPAWVLSVPFRFHLSRAASSPYSSS